MILRAISIVRHVSNDNEAKLIKKRCGGFSLPELLIVIVLILFMGTMAVSIYGNLGPSSSLNESTSLIIQTLRIARARSVAGLNDDSHGVSFQINPTGPDSFILYEGSVFDLNDTKNRVNLLTNDLTISTTLPGNDINFLQITGEPSNFGTVTLTHSVNGTRVISINSLGFVEEQ